MADDAEMVVTLTKGQLKELIIETVTQCYNSIIANPAILNPAEEIEIKRLSDLRNVYGISQTTASKWKQAMQKAGILHRFDGRWWTTKTDVDNWLRNN